MLEDGGQLNIHVHGIHPVVERYLLLEILGEDVLDVLLGDIPVPCVLHDTDPLDLGDDCAAVPSSYDLTPVNAPISYGGALGYALENDGTIGMRAAAADSADLSAAGGDLTVCVWANPNTVSDDNFYVGKDDWGSQREWHIRNNSNKPAFYYSRGCTTFEDSAETATNIIAGFGIGNECCKVDYELVHSV